MIHKLTSHARRALSKTRLVPPATTDTLVKNLVTAADRLRKHSKAQNAQAERIRTKAYDLNVRAQSTREDAHRAARVAEKVDALLN
jgi:hypothetical protein